MKQLTAMQQLISFISMSERQLTKNEIIKLIQDEFLYQERKSIELAYETGYHDFANLNYFAESPEDYFDERYDKFKFRH